MNKLISIAALSILTATAQAQTKNFTIGSSSPAQQIAQVESVTQFETFTGRTNKVTGTLTFDPKTRKGGGKIAVAASALDTGIELRNEHMRGTNWLETEKYPEITFETSKVQPLSGGKYRVTGKFGLRGIKKTITAEVNLNYLEESDTTRKAGFKGSVLRLKTSFPIKLSDYGIKIAGPAEGKVSPTVTVSLTAFGQSG